MVIVYKNIVLVFLFLDLFTCFFVNAEERMDSDKIIQQEWNDQRGKHTLPEAVQIELLRVERILSRQKNVLPEDVLLKKQEQFNTIRSRYYVVSSSGFESLYYEVRHLKRELMLGDPDIDFSDILCIDNPYPKGPEPTHEVRTRTENSAVYGGKLIVLHGLDPDARTSQLAPQHGAFASFWRPDLSFDGKSVLYSMRESTNKAYSIYEIGIDGKASRRITESDYNDLDPIYATDGNIIFSTSRSNQFLRCGGAGYRMFTFARCDKNGNNIYFISSNVDADFTPVFLQDGRILYTRWEYIDKSVFRIQSLWTVNPDGTDPQTYWGNQSRWPDMLINARPIPNSSEIIFSGAAHHDIFGGPLGIVNYKEGTNYPDGLYKLTNHIPWAEVGNGPADKYYNDKYSVPECYMAFQTPYPVSKNYILVSARKGTNMTTVQDRHLPNFDLYLMDFDGNMELIYRGEHNIFYGQPVRSRPIPQSIPSSVKWPGKMLTASQKAEWGTLYSSDVYEESGIPRGMVKSLRILEVEPQTYSDGCRTQDKEKQPFLEKGAIPAYHGYGETVVSLLMDDATKRIWGTVPVEEDGSVNFKVPPVKGVYFQLLDEKGRALQTMRSSTHVMPGETRGCYGCHKTKVRTPSGVRKIALKRKPSEVTPPVWGDSTISFARFVQPVLDRNCTKCHGGNRPDGNLDLSHKTAPNTPITWPYVKLVFGDNPKTVDEWAQKTIAGCIIPYHVYSNTEDKYPTEETVVPAMTALSYRSKLIEIATSGEHYGVKVTPQEEAKLVAWVDALCPFLGLEEIIAQQDMPAKEFVKQSDYNVDLSFPGLMRTAPYVHKEFMQDDFRTQEDRIPKDKKGENMPSFYLKEGKRIYRVP